MKAFRKNFVLKLAFISTLIVTLSGGLLLSSASAATNLLYLSPSTVSAQNGSTFTVNLRVTPGTPINTVHGEISYDASKVTLQAVDCSGSPFTPVPSCPTSGNPLQIDSANFSGTVSTDSFIAKLTFKANVGSGSSPIGLAGDTAVGGSSAGATTAGTTVTFTSPTTPTCGAGQTGTYPNCVTPTSPTCGAGQTGTYPNCVTPTKPTSGGSGSGGSSGSSAGATSKPTTPTSSTSTPAAANATATVTTKDVKFTEANITAVSKDPTQVYLQFGTASNALTQQTALSELGTTHTIAVDPSQLTPGQTYYYVVVSKSQTGVITQSAVDTFTTNGLTVRIGVFNKDHLPLKGKTVTLHSTPMTATTDSKGFATFSNVAVGTHHVIYTDGKKNLDQAVAVVNNVQTSGDTQTAPVQIVSVVYDITSSSILSSLRVVILVLLLVVVAVAAIFFGKRKLRNAVPGGAPLSVQPVVVGGSNGSGPIINKPVDSVSAPVAAETSTRLNSIPDPNKPQPGSTVAPGEDEGKQF